MSDMTDNNVLFVLHYMFLPRINADLEQFRQAWNRHKLSSEGNATPNELMLLNTENDGLQDVNEDDYGVEGEGGDEAEGEDGAHSVVVISPTNPMNAHQLLIFTQTVDRLSLQDPVHTFSERFDYAYNRLLELLH